MSELRGQIVEQGTFGEASKVLTFQSATSPDRPEGLIRALPFVGISTASIFDKSRGVVSTVTTATLEGTIISFNDTASIIADWEAMKSSAAGTKNFDLVILDGEEEYLRYTNAKLLSIDLQPGRMYSHANYTITLELTDYASDNLGVYNASLDLSWTEYNHVGTDGYDSGKKIPAIGYSFDGEASDYENAMSAMKGGMTNFYLDTDHELVGHFASEAQATSQPTAIYKIVTDYNAESSSSSMTQGSAGRQIAGHIFFNGYKQGLGVKTDYSMSVDSQSVPQVEISHDYNNFGSGEDALSFWNSNVRPNLFSSAESFAQSVNSNLVVENQEPSSVSVSISADGYVTTISTTYTTGPRYKFKTATHEVIDVTDKPGRPTFAIMPILGRSTGPILQNTSGRTEHVRELSIEAHFPRGTRPSSTEIDNVVSEFIPTGDTVFQGDITEVFGADEGRFTFSTSWVYT